LLVEDCRLIGVGEHLIELFVVRAVGTLDVGV